MTSSLSDSDDFAAVAILKERLLPMQEQMSNTASTGGEGCWTVPFYRLILLSFVTGSIVSEASQIFLGHVFSWKPPVNQGEEGAVPQSTQEIIVFSLLWSFCTCLIILGAIVGFVFFVGRYYFQQEQGHDSGTKTLEDEATPTRTASTSEDWDRVMFQLRARHLVRSLLFISLIWILVDIIQSVDKQNTTQAGEGTRNVLGVPPAYRNVMYPMISIAWYVAFFRWIVQKQRRDKSSSADSNSGVGLMSTYHLPVASLGLFSGLCSQFLLSFMLWRDHDMTKPIVDNAILFSILWSFCTVVFTFIGCLCLRQLTLDDETNNSVTAERKFLRMESHFIFCSLIGICGAWILIDFFMDMRELIVPSMLLLAFSLLAFWAIVSCFPIDECLADLDDDHDIQQLTVSTSSSTTTTTSSSDEELLVV